MNLNDALKYAAGEQEAFEKRIDQNPFDSDNHLIYADWLDDQGHSEEAAFRRAMGEWVRRGPSDTGPFPKIVRDAASFGVGEDGPDYFNEGHQRHTHIINAAHLPEWAKGIDRVGTARERETLEQPHLSYNPVGGWHYWRGYRNMEEGLRRAFRKNREQQSQ